MASDPADRTQAATPRRLQKARDEGSVPVSRELTSLAGLGAAALLFVMEGPSLGRAFVGRLRDLLVLPASQDPAMAIAQSVRAAMLLVGPIAGIVLAAAAAAVLLQTGFLLRVSAMAPDLGRLDPRRGLKRMFGTSGLVEAAKSLVKMTAFAGAAFLGISHAWSSLGAAPFWEPELLTQRILQETAHLLLLLLLGVQAVIAGADVAWSRYHHASDLRMSREDVRQESREAEGDPKVKARLRQMRLSRAKKRMLAAVPSATVVITNPTHYAIALVYDRGQQAAPRVVAKGVDEVAARIREVAQMHGVPLFASPLARALFSVELDSEIPLEHFKAVAEIIAYVWRLRKQVR